MLFSGLSVGGSGGDVELYKRHVKAVNLTVVEDDERLVGKSVPKPAGRKVPTGLASGLVADEKGNVRAMLGRGPGKPNGALSA